MRLAGQPEPFHDEWTVAREDATVGSFHAPAGQIWRQKRRKAEARTLGALVVGLTLICLLAGCSTQHWATLRSAPKNSLIERFGFDASEKEIPPSLRTMQVLRLYDLDRDVQKNMPGVLQKLQAITDQEPSLEKFYALSELSYLAARKAEKRDPRLAMDLYGASVLTAYRYLFDARSARDWNPYDPQFRGACDLYNGSLEAGLRLICAGQGLKPGQSYTIQTAGGSWDIRAELRGGRWKNEDFDHFKFVSDYELNGLRNHYKTYGLGVPLIAVRRSYSGEPVTAKFYPVDLSFPVTVL
ncbi:MAG: hypothetical protein JW818_00435, partial [Pirellulales bacterium]|nr:hypothetical protein [Pirellulales bacterium]